MQMTKKKAKNEKGISLVSLIIVIIVLVILTNVIIYNVSDHLKIENLKAMQNDVANLRDKVATSSELKIHRCATFKTSRNYQ